MSIVNIKYNDEILYSTNQNKTITLNCKDKEMASNLIVEIIEETLQFSVYAYENDLPASYKVTGLGTIIDKKVIVPNTYNGKNVVAIGDKAFEWANIASLTLGRHITSIGEKAFYCCVNLKSLDLTRITTISKAAFESCRDLEEIHISKALTSIGENAFIHCEELKTIYFAGSQSEWNEISGYFPATAKVVLV